LPASSLAVLALAVFLTFSSIAFVSDLAEPRPSAFWWVLVYAADTGIVAAAYALTATRFLPALPAAVALNLLSIYGLPRLLPLYSVKVPAATTVAQLHERHILDAWLVIALVTLGYALFYTFVGTEGARYVRLRTEIDLAGQLQARLVPPLDMTAAGLAICGKSMPSSRVGGDLIDAVLLDGSVTCYRADVSGHGIAAAVLMSMVKSAMRTIMAESAPLCELLHCLNDVLLDLKEPGMFVTLACLRSGGPGRLEYASAGHPPIFHYHSSTRTVSELKMEQLPIAMFPAVSFESCMITVEPADLLAIVSDGFLEVNNARGEEFGAESVRRSLVRSATEPLQRIASLLIEEAMRFGVQQDDQTVLLVKALG
jgi:serine phosphatase RsbU (regulator of sigma subunit)